MNTACLRRFEHGLPLFSGLDIGLLIEAQVRLQSGDFGGLTSIILAVGKAAELRTIRRLSAIWRATDVELEAAERDPVVMAALEAEAARRTFKEGFQDTLDFFAGLGESLGFSPVSSGLLQPEKATATGMHDQPQSENSPSEG